jgi:hypothetical protein
MPKHSERTKQYFAVTCIVLMGTASCAKRTLETRAEWTGSGTCPNDLLVNVRGAKEGDRLRTLNSSSVVDHWSRNFLIVPATELKTVHGPVDLFVQTRFREFRTTFTVPPVPIGPPRRIESRFDRTKASFVVTATRPDGTRMEYRESAHVDDTNGTLKLALPCGTVGPGDSYGAIQIEDGAPNYHLNARKRLLDAIHRTGGAGLRSGLSFDLQVASESGASVPLHFEMTGADNSLAILLGGTEAERESPKAWATVYEKGRSAPLIVDWWDHTQFIGQGRTRDATLYAVLRESRVGGKSCGPYRVNGQKEQHFVPQIRRHIHARVVEMASGRVVVERDFSGDWPSCPLVKFVISPIGEELLGKPLPREGIVRWLNSVR